MRDDAADPARPAPRPASLGRRASASTALACGLAAANIYYTQPLVEPIRASLGLPAATAGLVATATQIGYAAGLVLLLPLCDLVENRRLAIVLLCVCTLAALAAPHGGIGQFLAAALILGAASVVVQVLLLVAVATSPAGARGRVVGTLTSALLIGVMLSRAFAGTVAEALGWQAVFHLAGAAMLALAFLMARTMPLRYPGPGDGYARAVFSMGILLATDPVLRRRSLHHAGAFAAFSLFWTVVPLHLADRFLLSQAGIAAFSLTGVSSVAAALLSGRVPERALRGPVTVASLAAVSAALLFAGSPMPGTADSVPALACASLVLCIGLTVHAVLAQRDILSTRPDAHGRSNGAFMAAYFTGGALGSALGAWLYAIGGWQLATLCGGLLALPALLHAAWRSRFP